jgi:putative transposase
MKRMKQKKDVDQGIRQLVLQMPEVIAQQLHEMVVGAGLTVLAGMLEAERESVCGPRYAHVEGRRAHRAGHAPGELALGGRRVSVKRPRARTVDGDEVQLKTWEAFADDDPLHRRALEQMVIGVSTRKYARSLEPVAAKTRGTSKSAVSRRFVALTKKKLDAMLESSIGELKLAVLMIDGIHIDDHVVLVALGIDEEGRKHVLGLHEGATENATACKGLLANLRQRGLRTDRSILVVIDGSTALRKAVRDVLGKKGVVQRCQIHKRRNVVDYLPEGMRTRIDTAMAQAYRCGDEKKAKRLLTNLANVLEEEHPSASASLREGLDETLTVLRFGLPEALVRTLSTTNAIENIQGGIRRVCRRVTTWRGGSMILRWVGAALVEHARGFRRLRGHKGMAKLVAELRTLDGENTVAHHRKAA